MRFRITKCHGSGNDFPMIDARGLRLADDEWARVARALADRAGPVGGDGLLLMTEGTAERPIGFRMFNSDGSEAETCLNGLRCVARLGFEALGIEALGEDWAGVQLNGSVAEVARAADLAPGVYTVRERSGPASLDASAWPLGDYARIVDEPVAQLGARRFTAVAIPNPHLVSFVATVDEAELVRVGRACEAAPAWLPRRANVSFVEVRGQELFVRTFERGVGLTNACGSAMAASTYAACLTERLEWDRETMVRNRGGLVRASASADGMVELAGNATFEWAGEVEVEAERVGKVTATRRFADEIAAWEAVAGVGR